MPAFTPDEKQVSRGFRVEIEGGAGGTDVDAAWESVSGGEQTWEPGQPVYGAITLRGAMTARRAALEAWINETLAGKTSIRTVSITPIDEQGMPGPTYRFFECALSVYRLPPLVRNPCDPKLREEVRFVYRDWTAA
jgi:hypothetical protein